MNINAIIKIETMVKAKPNCTSANHIRRRHGYCFITDQHYPTLSTFENIIIGLLGLLAVDALSERISVLEQIESNIHALTENKLLRKRTEMLRTEEIAQHASEICILAVHASYALAAQEFLHQKLKAGCSIRIILLNPNSPYLDVRTQLINENRTKGYIELSLKTLEMIMTHPDIQGKCEVRLIDMMFPYLMLGVDMEKNSGLMNVNYNASPFKIVIDDPPHVHLNAMIDKYWFNYYREHFELAWSKAVPWNPGD